MKNAVYAAIATFAVVSFGVARADPPPPGSDEDKSLKPYSEWFMAQSSALGHCCSMADGRIVDWRISGDHYEVRFLHPESILYGDKPVAGKYYPVADIAVLHGTNPTGYGIAWWAATPLYTGGNAKPDEVTRIRCFQPESVF